MREGILLSLLLAGCIRAVNMMERKKVLSSTYRKKNDLLLRTVLFCSGGARCVKPRDANLFTWNWRVGGGA